MSTRGNNALAQIPARTWKIAAVTGLGAFMAMLDSTVANLALESIRTDFGSTLSIIQWVVTGYLIALAVSLPTAGWLGLRYGYGRVWSIAVAGFIVASALCGLAPGPWTLIGARLLQGLAAGLMVPAGQAVIGSTAKSSQLGRLMGTLGLVIALGPAVGPAVGGVLLEVTSWRTLFWINVPIGIAALMAAKGLVPGGARSAGRPLDKKGLLMVSIGLPLLLYGATKISAAGVSFDTVCAIGAGAALIVCFVLCEPRIHQPLIDLKLMRRRTFSAATTTAGLTGVNMYGGLLLLPLYLQLAMNRTVSETGFMLLVMGLGSAVVLPVAGTLTDRFGARRTAFTGAVVLLVSTIPFVIFLDKLTTTALVLLLVTRGIGIALAQMPAMTAAYASVKARQMGDATTLVNMVQRIGGAMGAAMVVIVLAQFGGTENATAYIGVFATLTVLAILTLTATAFMPRHTDQA